MVVCGLIVTVVLLGGLTQVQKQSGPFTASTDRSFARTGTVISDASNVTGTNVRHLLAVMRSESRRSLQEQLDTAVQQVTDQQSEADTLIGTDVQGGLGAQFRTVFTDRARAVTELRTALDGLLGMHPLAVPGAPGSASTAVAAPTLVSASAAINRIAAAGAVLQTSNTLYRGVRHALARSEAHLKLPVSTWANVSDLSSISAVTTAVDLVATSSSLAATHNLELRTLQLSPPALPSPSGANTPGVSVMSPTGSVSVSVVLANLGSVDEPGATVQFSLIPQPGGAAVVKNRRVAVATGTAVTLGTVTFPVKSGHDYQLSVSVMLPPDQTDVTNTSISDLLEIDPGT
jgi:hypothetical protein